MLRPGGFAVVTSVMYFPIHAYPSDYWRFTPEGFRAMGRPFERVMVEWAGLRDFPHSVVLIGAREDLPDQDEARLRVALKDWRRHDSQTWKEIVSLWMPPILFTPAYRWYNERAARKERARRGRAPDAREAT